MATRLDSGNIQLRQVNYAPMQQVVPRGVDYVGSRAEAQANQTLANVIDRMGQFANAQIKDIRVEQAMQYAAQNPITPQQIEAAKNGDTSELIPQGNFSYFDQAVRKARSFELSNAFEMEGRQQLSQMLAQIEAGQPITAEQVSSKITSITDGYTASLAKIDGEAALKFRASMATHGNSVLSHALALESKKTKEQGLVKLEMDLDNRMQLYKAALATNPNSSPVIADMDRKTMLDQAALHGPVTLEKFRKDIDARQAQIRVDAVSEYVTSPEFSADPLKAITRLDGNDAGKMSSVWGSMSFEEKTKIRSALRDIVSLRQGQTEKAEKELHEQRVVEAATLTLRYLDSGGRDSKALKDLKALSILDPKAISPEKVFDLPKKLKEGEQINAGGEFKLKTEIMEGLIPNAQALQRRARELGVSEKRLNDHVLGFYISRGNEEERDIENSFRLEAKTVAGQTNLTQKQTDALIGLQSKFQKTYKQEVEKARAEGKVPPTRIEIRDRILKERRESIPAQRINSTLSDLNTYYGVSGSIRKTGITFTEETSFADISSQSSKLGLKSEDLEAIRQKLNAINEQRKRLDSL
jgi:hypothetical protein